MFLEKKNQRCWFEYIYMRYMNICFIEHIYGSLDCGEKSGYRKWQGYSYRLHCLLLFLLAQ
mgnify:FL=1